VALSRPVARRELAEQRHGNRQLQYAILPKQEPAAAVNGMRIAVRYEGADRSADVGGDWYLSEPLPDGRLLLAVGDVVGHGLAATATMVCLRNAAVGLAMAGLAPGDILTVLNRMLCQRDDEASATAVVATYEARSRQLTWARAGHVPILIANRAGVRTLWHPNGAILGVLPEAEYPHATKTLHVDDVLVMYTDAFVEEPGIGLDDGVRALAEHTRRALAGAELDPMADRPTVLTDRLRRRNRRDDACLRAAEPVG
jgi:serine phosphatase RsbU (regulator of sigma subunit)